MNNLEKKGIKKRQHVTSCHKKIMQLSPCPLLKHSLGKGRCHVTRTLKQPYAKVHAERN